MSVWPIDMVYGRKIYIFNIYIYLKFIILANEHGSVKYSKNGDFPSLCKDLPEGQSSTKRPV